MEPYLEKLLSKTSTQKVNNKNSFESELGKYPYMTGHFPVYEKLSNPKEYEIIKESVWEMWKSGVITRGSGFCLSMSDMISKVLTIKGIPCELIECDLTVFNSVNPSISLVGHDKVTKSNYETIDSHVVCLAGTKDKFLIDLSIAHFKDLVERFFVVQKIEESENSTLGSFNFNGVIWNYNVKKNSKLPELHQQSILNRINTDNKIFQNIKKINIVITIILIFSSLNFIRGVYDFNQKYIIMDNDFGPTKSIK